MTRTSVQREALYQKTSRNFSYIFERVNQDDIKQYKHRQFLSPSLADDVNENVSLISYAYLLDNSIAKRVVDFFVERNVVRGAEVASLRHKIVLRGDEAIHRVVQPVKLVE